MEERIIECVPNYSEGRDINVIRQITDAIESVEGVRLLHVDPGVATNRTVVTFLGSPEAVVEAAFRGSKRAAEVIDMRKHQGTHPRMGATDVLPLIPVSGITLEETAELARQLAARLAHEAGIPCYAYEAAALRPAFRNLAVCRAGEYEALQEKLTNPEKRPDFMPEMGESGETAFHTALAGGGSPASMIPESIQRSGITVVGARDFLIAVNWNLNTTDTAIASEIACDVREKGRKKREGDPVTGRPVLDANGRPVMIPGTLKCTKAIGWYIEEYGIAQVSMNMTNINVTPLHRAYEEVCRCAKKRGVEVTGTEIIGLLPKRALLEAGRYFLQKEGVTAEALAAVDEEVLIKKAVKSMGLDDLKPFDPHEKVLEFAGRYCY